MPKEPWLQSASQGVVWYVILVVVLGGLLLMFPPRRGGIDSDDLDALMNEAVDSEVKRVSYKLMVVLVILAIALGAGAWWMWSAGADPRRWWDALNLIPWR